MHGYKHKQKYYADKYVASQQKVSEWQREGWPLDDEKAMCKKFRLMQRMSPKRRKAVEAIERRIAKANVKPVKRKSKPSEKIESRKTLEEFRDYYSDQLSKATATKPPAPDEVKHWNKLLLDAEKCIRESEAHIKKLDIDQGRMVSQQEVERMLRAIIYAGNASIRAHLKELCEDIAACKTPAEVYAILPAMVLGGRIFEGVKKVSKSGGDVQLPQWVVDCVIAEGENYFE